MSAPDASIAFAVSLRQLRRERGWTQYDLSLKAGVSQAVISRVEGGVSETTLRTAEMLADALEAGLRNMLAESPRDCPLPVARVTPGGMP